MELLADHPVNGDARFPTGKGLLIITGNATISGSTTWQGVILVGGTITSNGNNTVPGAIVTGLNVQLGTSVASVRRRQRDQDLRVQLLHGRQRVDRPQLVPADSERVDG